MQATIIALRSHQFGHFSGRASAFCFGKELSEGCVSTALAPHCSSVPYRVFDCLILTHEPQPTSSVMLYSDAVYCCCCCCTRTYHLRSRSLDRTLTTIIWSNVPLAFAALSNQELQLLNKLHCHFVVFLLVSSSFAFAHRWGTSSQLSVELRKFQAKLEITLHSARILLIADVFYCQLKLIRLPPIGTSILLFCLCASSVAL